MKRSGIQRKKKCRACGAEFQPMNSLAKACSPACALELVDRERERKEARARKESRAWIRKQKQALKTRGDHTREAQQAFNAYIRARDAHLPCISCGTYTAGQFHAGHYRTTKAAPELRFDEANVHKQCAQCNNFDSGNIVEYRINLIARIGEAEVNRLEGPNEPKKYTIDDLKAIKAKYRALVRELERKAA